MRRGLILLAVCVAAATGYAQTPCVSCVSVERVQITAPNGNVVVAGTNGAYLPTGAQIVAVGAGVGDANTTGGDWTAVGWRALLANTTGNDNNAFGVLALRYNTTGGYNTALSNTALYSNVTGSRSNAVGVSALYNALADENNAFGYRSAYRTTTGTRNSVFGHEAHFSNLTGSFNVVAGWQAGWYATSDYNTFIGYVAGPSAEHAAVTNSTAIGHGAEVTKSHQVVLGNASVTETVLRGPVVPTLAGSGNAYACLDATGKLYRSLVPCL